MVTIPSETPASCEPACRTFLLVSIPFTTPEPLVKPSCTLQQYLLHRQVVLPRVRRLCALPDHRSQFSEIGLKAQTQAEESEAHLAGPSYTVPRVLPSRV